jgi:hypothetical protein
MNKNVIERATNFISPYHQNVIINASTSVQKELIQSIRNKFVNGLGTFEVITLDGNKLMEDMRNVIAEVANWCIKRDLEQPNLIENEYRKLQQSNYPNKMSKNELESFRNSIWSREILRDKELRSRMMSRTIFEDYLSAEIYKRVQEYLVLNKITSEKVLNPAIFSELLKMQKSILNGNIEEYINIKKMMIHMIVSDLCYEIYKKYGIGFFVLLKNEDGIIDTDLHKIINDFVVPRTASLSMNQMTRMNCLFCYSISRNFMLEEIHDVITTDVSFIRKHIKI